MLNSVGCGRPCTFAVITLLFSTTTPSPCNTLRLVRRMHFPPHRPPYFLLITSHCVCGPADSSFHPDYPSPPTQRRPPIVTSLQTHSPSGHGLYSNTIGARSVCSLKRHHGSNLSLLADRFLPLPPHGPLPASMAPSDVAY